jgi:hypothetical protein
MKLPLQEYILALVGVIALVLLITRLLVSGLARLYKYFFSYLIVDLIETAEPFFIRFGQLYGNVFFALQCIKLCFYVLIVFELYSIILRDLKGLARLARRFSAVALGISVLLSLLVVAALPHQRNLLKRLFYFEIPIVSSLVLFMLLMTAFLTYYPVRLHRNALVYVIGYAIYFYCRATLLFLNLYSSASLRPLSTGLMILGQGCIVFWAILLNPAGEQRMMALGASWSSPERKQQVLDRLRELNDILLRARPK